MREAGVVMQVGFNRRFDPNFMLMQTLSRAGKVGDILQVRITSRDPSPPPPEYAKVVPTTKQPTNNQNNQQTTNKQPRLFRMSFAYFDLSPKDISAQS